MSVKFKKETKMIPSYPPKKATELPMFFEKRPYQGASGRIYPIPFSDQKEDEKRDLPYEFWTLENEYVRTELLPAFGGKMYSGFDKINHYDFIYKNNVVKPALVGIAGPWVSGGIEFNYPQHHRPTTFIPAEAYHEIGANGEETVWMGEIDPLHHLKGMVGISLEPGRSYIKAKIRMYNRTDFPKVYMWWSNLAVPVNDNYRTIFPPDVEWVYYHDRYCHTTWPFAKNNFATPCPFDYGNGRDLSLFPSIETQTSIMVPQGQSDFDFVAGYDMGKQAGIVCIGDHHKTPGKKMWTWGTSDSANCWCNRSLSDNAGNYIELMTGTYTDNQPDFTWMLPYETRDAEQYWYPIREIGGCLNATKDAAFNAEKRGNDLFFGIQPTGTFKNATLVLYHGDEEIFRKTLMLSPDKPFTQLLKGKAESLNVLRAELTDADGNVLVSYEPVKRGMKDEPRDREAVKKPSEYQTVEELYINGLHLEQYLQANYDPEDYYLEGLKRDPGDIRCNTGMARVYYRKARYEEALEYIEKACERLLDRNSHPMDTESLYLKGLILRSLGRNKEAYDVFGMSAWGYSYCVASNVCMAELDCLAHRYTNALTHLQTATRLAPENEKAQMLMSVVLRYLGQTEQAEAIAKRVHDSDLLDCYSAFEMLHYGSSKKDFLAVFDGKPENILNLAFEYLRSGFYDDVLTLIKLSDQKSPMFRYCSAYILRLLGKTKEAIKEIKSAEKEDYRYCFPAFDEEIEILRYALKTVPNASNASYYLGNLFYDRCQYEKAISLWESSAKSNPNHPIVFRNLAFSYSDKMGDPLSAKMCMEIALKNNPEESRLVFEYELLLKHMNATPDERIAFYEKHMDVTLERYDCRSDYITLLLMKKKYADAIRIAKSHPFHVYEGGEGMTGKHTWMHLLYGLELAKSGKTKEAEQIYLQGLTLFENYNEGKFISHQESHLYYFLGVLQNEDKECFEKASSYYNLPVVSLESVFRALALRKLNRFGEANQVLNALLQAGEETLKTKDVRGYFGNSTPAAKILDGDIVKEKTVNGNIMKAYALLGLGRYLESHQALDEAKKYSPYDFRIYCYEQISDSVEKTQRID